jgi:hypothetical protein
MRYNEFVNEAPMNPSAYNAALTTGQDSGVKVGFEFEVHAKSEIFMGQTKEKTRSMKQMYELWNDNWGYMLPFEAQSTYNIDWFDKTFKPKPAFKFNSLQEAIDNALKDRVAELRKLFEMIPEKTREVFIPLTMRMSEVHNAKGSVQQFLFMKHFHSLVEDAYYEEDMDGGRFDAASLAYSKSKAALESIENITKTIYIRYYLNVFDLIDKDNVDKTGYFESRFDIVDTKSFNRALDDFNDNSDELDEEELYAKAAPVMAQHIKTLTANKVHVFKEYHQRNKNLKDWYIEPDGSLSADESNDASLEIVSPPLSAAEAVKSLKGFYALAKQLGLYTNKTTGLHINVSIPKKLDILKLAVFLGDQYVLNYFNRQDNRYATSVLDGLKKGIASERDDIKQENPQDQLRMLQSLANDEASSHTASISQSANGKYISFRHAGNDYLNDFEGVYNVLGRFVRAMIIASDPNMYRREYFTKLSAMVQGPAQLGGAPVNPTMSIIRQKGLPMVSVYAVRLLAAPEGYYKKQIQQFLKIPVDPNTTEMIPVQVVADKFAELADYEFDITDYGAREQKNAEGFRMTFLPSNATQLDQLLKTKSVIRWVSKPRSYNDGLLFVAAIEYVPLKNPEIVNRVKQIMRSANVGK